jgi:putative flippase GtrA
MAATSENSSANSLFIQLYRYAIVGGIAFAFDFASLFALTHFLGVHYLVSAAVAFVIGILVNYALSTAWVFTRRSVQSKRVEFLVFALVGVAGLGLNTLFMWFFTEIARFHYLLSKIVSAMLVYLWNFFARKYTLFR